MTPTPNFFEKIVNHAHKQGIKFTFDIDCCAVGCDNVSKWEQEIVHQTEGKINMPLCNKHMKDFDNDVSFNIEVVQK